MSTKKKSKPYLSLGPFDDKHLTTLTEPELLARVMAEYWIAHPAESPVKAFASMLRCSEQHLYNCLPGGRQGHIGMEAWIEIELRTGTGLVTRWWNSKQHEVNR